ncbi:hypothetical protein SLS62_007372 [Diatrype stigma]|uniref:Xylanolytic transcriptional activator regulatory domain-containing protein n=1 Tax=Diatrype stigma TaxID=117547 RepID=A0AAN9UPT2_9PEZI
MAVSKFTEDDGAQALEVGDHTADATKPDDEVEKADSTPSQNLGTPGSTSSLINGFTSTSFGSVDDYWKQLPPQPIMHQLIQLYFERLHEDFPLFHRGTFEEEYEQYLGELRRRSRPQPSNKNHNNNRQGAVDLEPGWLGCLHMILVFASMSNPDVGGGNLDHVGLRRHCVAATRSSLPYFVSKCTLNNLRALLLLALFLHNNNERNATWNLVGTASRIASALGLHRSDTGVAFKPIEREVRKRVFCTLYIFEQFLASSLGRPTGLGESDVDVVPPREGLLDGGGGGGDAVFVAFSLRLYRILGKTRTGALGHNGNSETRFIEGIFSDLREWNKDLSKQQSLVVPFIKTGEPMLDELEPGAMGFDELKTVLGWQNKLRQRASLLLRLQYHYVALLVTRPFLLRELSVGNQGSDLDDRNTPRLLKNQVIQQAALSDTCLRHAAQLALNILLLGAFDLLNGISGLDLFYVYWASMILNLGIMRAHSTSQGRETVGALSRLVLQLREVVSRVEKSGTMKRFATLMDAFSDYVNHSVQDRTAEQTGATNSNINENPASVAREVGGGSNRVEGPDRQSSAAFNALGPDGMNTIQWYSTMLPAGNTIEGGLASSWGHDLGLLSGMGYGSDWMMGSFSESNVDLPMVNGGHGPFLPGHHHQQAKYGGR